MTEFTFAQGADYETSFNWWVKHVLKKRDRLIASIRKQQSRYLKWSDKLGIELPKTLEQAYALDAENGNYGQMRYPKNWEFQSSIWSLNRWEIITR